jgi:hypothetical protein
VEPKALLEVLKDAKNEKGGDALYSDSEQADDV